MKAGKRDLALIGAPSSAGAYAPGQEQAPWALRQAGVTASLGACGHRVTDLGDVPGFRWRVDRQHPGAMNSEAVAAVARRVAHRAAGPFSQGRQVVVLGGDCTVELGTVAAALTATPNIGLVYIDLDADLNTPESTQDGALDWMGVAHMLGLPGTVDVLAGCGPRRPLLEPHRICYFGVDNIEPFEQHKIERLGIRAVRLAEVAADPARAARELLDSWGRRFESLLVHLDVDVLDYVDIQLAENNRRNWGLRFEQLVAALRIFVQEERWSGLTVCELNPDHGESGGETLRRFVKGLAEAFAPSPPST